MTGTTWTSTSTDLPARHGTQPGATLAALWRRAVTRPLHRVLDNALQAGELRELGPGTLTDIGYRRG